MKATPWSVCCAIVYGPPKVFPPSVDTIDWIWPASAQNGTTSVPFGCASGWPPRPCAPETVTVFQVCPPSVDRLMVNVSPLT